MKAKAFDCVEIKRKGAEKVRQESAGMSLNEELDCWRRGTEELRALQESMRKDAVARGRTERSP